VFFHKNNLNLKGENKMQDFKKLGTMALPEMPVVRAPVDTSYGAKGKVKNGNYSARLSHVREHNRAKRFGREQRRCQVD